MYGRASRHRRDKVDTDSVGLAVLLSFTTLPPSGIRSTVSSTEISDKTAAYIRVYLTHYMRMLPP